VEKFGAAGGAESIEAFPDTTFELIWPHLFGLPSHDQ
jgi:hypothetical protein